MKGGLCRLAMFVALLAPDAQAAGCGDAATQTELNACAAHDFSKADAALNAAYRQIVARLKTDSGAPKLLVAAQKAWLSFRDSECMFRASATTGGSIHSMMVATCQTDLTQTRTKSLQAYLACKEGDLLCPVPAP